LSLRHFHAEFPKEKRLYGATHIRGSVYLYASVCFRVLRLPSLNVGKLEDPEILLDESVSKNMQLTLRSACCS